MSVMGDRHCWFVEDLAGFGVDVKGHLRMQQKTSGCGFECWMGLGMWEWMQGKVWCKRPNLVRSSNGRCCQLFLVLSCSTTICKLDK